MVAGLPVTAWVLIVVSVGLGLSIALAFFFKRRREHRPPAHPDPPG